MRPVGSPPSLTQLPERWRRAPRHWGHSLHSVCSYFAMFPPQIPNVFIRWLTSAGDAVYDPFSGRGTVTLEAVLAGRIGYASDANPLATALTAAKTQIPARAAVRRRITQLERRYQPGEVDTVPDHIRMLYASSTLEQLLFLRTELRRARCVDAFLVAALLGLLHGNHSKCGATRGLSISMPNTFAMSPGYVRNYITEHQLEAPQVDVFQMLRRRVSQLDLPSSRIDGGKNWTQDSTGTAPEWLQTSKVKLVFTSPPYLQVIKYGKYNWVRLWFLDEEPRAVDERLTDTGSLVRYRAFMAETLASLDGLIRDDGYVCLVIGDVRREGSDSINLAGDVWSNVAEPQGWRLHGIVNDRLPLGRKVSRIWKDTPGRATRTDRILILSRAGTDHELPALGRITWKRRPTWPAVASAGGTHDECC
jgi:hypothetical protein